MIIATIVRMIRSPKETQQEDVDPEFNHGAVGDYGPDPVTFAIRFRKGPPKASNNHDDGALYDS
jgi:hypothetical protein